MAKRINDVVPKFPRGRGFTLIELMVTLAVAIILTLWATTAIQRLLERQRLSAAVEAVQAQVVLAKSEAAKRSQDVALNLTPGASWDVTLTYLDVASASIVSRVIDSDSYGGVVMATSVVGGFIFEPVRGTVSPSGAVTLASPSDLRVRIAVDPVGRMTICSPNFGRYPTCN